jgi:hypothetical protein
MTSDPVSPAEPAALAKAEFVFPGPLRDRLVAAILDGSKTTTTGLVRFRLVADLRSGD